METIEEIRKFFTTRKKSYTQALAKIKRLLDDYHRDRDEGRRAIYRVATREDYAGEEFKTEESIQEKLKDRRKTKPDYGLVDIDDYVGLRVVCVYPSDVDIVQDFIWSLRKGGKLAKCEEKQVNGRVKIKPKKGDVTRVKTGYKARHFIVRLPGRLNICACEIQVLTMLQDAAAVKSHDLIYKPASLIKERHVRQAKLLSDSLETIDEQSRMLEREIRRKRLIEDEKKKTAKKALILDLVLRGEFPEGSEIRKLRDHIIKKEEELRYGDADEELNRISDIAKEKLDINLCRLGGLLAIINRDYEEFALGILDQYLLRSLDDRDKSEGHRFKSLLLSTLGKREAIEQAEKALQYATNSNDRDLINKAEANIAYFIAEFEQIDREAEARTYSKKVYDESPTAKNLETKGYVQIMFAKDFNEVQQGWDLCRKALKLSEREDSSKDKEIRRLFVQLDEYKAIEQLWDFLEAEAE